MATVDEILDGAADIIETKGWSQGYLKNQKGMVCAYGAILEMKGYGKQLEPSTTNSSTTSSLFMLEWGKFYDLAESCPVTTYLESKLPGDVRIWTWNDRSKSKEEVVDVLRNVAKQYREETQV